MHANSFVQHMCVKLCRYDKGSSNGMNDNAVNFTYVIASNQSVTISTHLHVAKPLLVSWLRAPDVTSHVHFHVKLIRETDAFVQHVQPVRNELLECLQLQNVTQERLHVWRPRKYERIGIKFDPLSRLKTQCITVSACSIQVTNAVQHENFCQHLVFITYYLTTANVTNIRATSCRRCWLNNHIFIGAMKIIKLKVITTLLVSLTSQFSQSPSKIGDSANVSQEKTGAAVFSKAYLPFFFFLCMRLRSIIGQPGNLPVTAISVQWIWLLSSNKCQLSSRHIIISFITNIIYLII